MSRLLGEVRQSVFLPSRTSCKEKRPGLGGQREQQENLVRTMLWLLWLVWNPTLLRLSASPPLLFHPGGHVLHTADTYTVIECNRDIAATMLYDSADRNQLVFNPTYHPYCETNAPRSLCQIVRIRPSSNPKFARRTGSQPRNPVDRVAAQYFLQHRLRQIQSVDLSAIGNECVTGCQKPPVASVGRLPIFQDVGNARRR